MTEITNLAAVECTARTASVAVPSFSPLPASLAMPMRMRTMCAMRMRTKGSG